MSTVIVMRLLLFLLLLPVLAYGQALDRAHIAYTNPLEFGADCNATTLQAAITSVGTNKQTMMITKTNRTKAACTWIIATDITFDINTTVWLPSGVSLIPNSGVTITFNGPVKVDDVDSLQGAGTYVFNYAENSEASPYIASGCGLTVPASSITLPAFACVASLLLGEKSFTVPQAETSLTLTTTTGVNWLLFDFSKVRTITGWTRKAGTHYMFQQVTAQPATPAGSIIFGKVTVASNVITAVEHVANIYPVKPSTLLGWHNVKEYGAKCDGTTDDSAAIQRADFAAEATGSAVVYFPGPGLCNIGTTTINITQGNKYKGTTYARYHSGVLYSGTGSALRFNSNVVNSSGYAQVTVEDMVVRHATVSGGSNTGAGIEINAGGWSYFQIKRVEVVGAFKYGIIMDATEVSSIEDSLIENGVSVTGSINIWVTNGADRTAGQNQGFTNGLTIARNQMNGAFTGLADDGGLNHSIIGNNFNGHIQSHRAARMRAGVIQNNNYEGTSTGGRASLIFTDSTLHTLTSTGGGFGVKIHGNLFSTSTNEAAGTGATLQFIASLGGFHTGIHITGNYFDSYLGRGGAINVTDLRWSFAGYNYDFGLAAAPATAHYVGETVDGNGNTLLYPNNIPATFTDAARNAYNRTDVHQYFAGGFAVGASANSVVTQIIGDNALWDPASIAAAGTLATSLTINGAALGDRCTAGFDASLAGMMLTCYVSAVDTVIPVLFNPTAGAVDIGSGSTRVRILLFR